MIYSVVSICCLCLFNDFIRILYGESMQFEFIIVLLIVFKFYLKGMRSTLTLFKEAFGLYWEDRYRPILETVLNLLFSVILTIKIGIAGVFIGTILSNLLSNLMIEPYIVFKCGLNESSGRYYVQYLRYLFVFLLNSMVLLRISDLIVVSSFVNLILKASMVFLLALCGNSIFFIRTKEFKMLQKRVVQVLKIKKKSL